jgi:dihydropyrimidine dehydrogenase (NAD+) subunit PreA
MADLRTEFLGLPLANPILAAASAITNDVERLRRLEQAGIGGVVTKLVSPLRGRPFRSVVRPEGWFAYGDRRLTLEEGRALVSAAKAALRMPVIANVEGAGVDPASWAASARALEAAGADAIELHLTTPNPEAPDREQALDIVTVGEIPELAARLTAAVRGAVRVPILAKLTPKAPDLVAVARACLAAGATGLTTINAMRGLAPLDVGRLGRPAYPFMEAQALSAVLGPALAPFARRYTAEVARATGGAVSSSGGVMTARDVVERLLLGAGTVQLCSALYYRGLGVVREMLDGLAAHLDEHAVKSPRDLVGRGLSHFVPRSTIQSPDLVAVLTTARHCPDCPGPCVTRAEASCDAIGRAGPAPTIRVEACTGCSLCFWACPYQAIAMTPATPSDSPAVSAGR